MKINCLLKNENLLLKLNLNENSFRDLVLARGKTAETKLTDEDLLKSLGEFSTDDQQIVEFSIGLLIRISTLNNIEKDEEILLFYRNATINDLFQVAKGNERGFKYLGSRRTKKIIDFNQNLSNINETQFLLIKEDQFCSVSIRRSTENQLILIDDEETVKTQDFASSATVADVYLANGLIDQNKYLLFGTDFMPSMETPMSTFISTSPIEFIVTDDKLPIHIFVENDVDKQKIDYFSSSKTQFSRLCSIACQIMHLDPKFYQLMWEETELSDGEMCLEDLDGVAEEIQLKLICISQLMVSIKFEEATVVIPCSEETLASHLTEEVLLKLNFSKTDVLEFELFALVDDGTQIEMDFEVKDIRDIFPENTEVMTFELRRKN